MPKQELKIIQLSKCPVQGPIVGACIYMIHESELISFVFTLPNFSPFYHNTFLYQITSNWEELAMFSLEEYIHSKHYFTLTLGTWDLPARKDMLICCAMQYHDAPTQYAETFNILSK